MKQQVIYGRIRTGTAGQRRDSHVQVLLSAKKVASQTKGEDSPYGNHDGLMAKTFAHSNSHVSG
jgi:hypothetical protein